MSHTTCCCSASLERCDRCDLLVGLEGFHLMGVARGREGLVLDVGSRDPTNHRLRTLLITAGLDASPHTQL